MKKITILVLHLGIGGIENISSTLANLLSKDYDVEILSVYRLNEKPAYELDDKIKVKYVSNIKPNKKEMLYYLKKKNYIKFIKGISHSIKTLYVKYIKTIFEIKKIDSDVIITTRYLHNYMVGKYANKKIKKIAWEHNHHNNNKRYIKKVVNSVKDSNYLVCVSNEIATFYKKYINEKSLFIPNCIDSKQKYSSTLENKNIIAVGRLSYVKGFDDMIKLFGKVNNKYPNWKLNIIGDGTEKEKLYNLTNELKLNDKVIFHGYQNKDYINDMFMKSSIYLMTSRTEAYPLVLLEAMNCGVPCISYTSAQGAKEIITNEKDGYLIESRNEDEMLEKISLLIDNEILRKKMGHNAKLKSKNYTSEVIIEKWKKIIEK